MVNIYDNFRHEKLIKVFGITLPYNKPSYIWTIGVRIGSPN